MQDECKMEGACLKDGGKKVCLDGSGEHWSMGEKNGKKRTYVKTQWNHIKKKLEIYSKINDNPK